MKHNSLIAKSIVQMLPQNTNKERRTAKVKAGLVKSRIPIATWPVNPDIIIDQLNFELMK